MGAHRIMKGKPQKIKNHRHDNAVRHCGHGFEFARCPYRYCAGRAMLEALKRIDRQIMTGARVVGHDAVIAARAAIRLAAETPTPEDTPTAVGGSVLTAAILEKQRLDPEYQPTKSEARALALDAVLFGRVPWKNSDHTK